LKYACRGLGLIDRNPWEGIDIAFKTTNKRTPWADDEPRKCFTTALYKACTQPTDKKAGADAAYWIPLLRLYTGARVGELAQLPVYAAVIMTKRAICSTAAPDEKNPAGQAGLNPRGLRSWSRSVGGLAHSLDDCGSRPHAAVILYFPVGLRQQLLDLGLHLLRGGVLRVEQAHQGNCSSDAGTSQEYGYDYGGEAHLNILGVDGPAAYVAVTVAHG